MSGLNHDKEMVNVLKKSKTPFVLHHMKGTTKTMQKKPSYNNVLLDIYDFFEEKLKLIRKKGITHSNIILDPGIGFAKTLDHNYSILKNLSVFLDLGHLLMIGISRKSLIKSLTKNNTLTPSVVLAINAYTKGAKILRVHDVKEAIECIQLNEKIKNTI